jgi:hypothetical protein
MADQRPNDSPITLPSFVHERRIWEPRVWRQILLQRDLRRPAGLIFIHLRIQAPLIAREQKVAERADQRNLPPALLALRLDLARLVVPACFDPDKPSGEVDVLLSQSP